MSATHSSPQKKSHPSVQMTTTPPPEVFQHDLKKHVEEELSSHAWEFGPDDIACMLSPKILKHEPENGGLLELCHFDILIDHPRIESAMGKLFKNMPKPSPFHQEVKNYDNITKFLNECVKLCTDTYRSIQTDLQASEFNLQEFGKAFWPALRFVKYHKPTFDKVQNAAPLKPDIVGLVIEDMPSGDFVACWSKPPKSCERNLQRIAVAVEVKDRWKDLLLQSGTYGRAQFNDTPLRSFTATIAINHATETLRVLIFHRGGLSASKELRLTTKDGEAHDIRKFMKILLSMLLWQTPGDAGFPEFTDGKKFIFPSGEDDTVEAIHQEVLYNRPSSRGCNTFVALMQLSPSNNKAVPQTPLVSGTGKPPKSQIPAPIDAWSKKPKLGQVPNDKNNDMHDSIFPSPYDFSGSFGIRFHDHQATRKQRMYEKVSNSSLILKGSWPPHEKKDVECNMYRHSKGEFGTATLLSSYEPFNSRGYKSTNSYFLPSPKSEARWLSTYQCGYLQRDVSIGNVLKLVQPTQMAPFNINKLKDFHDVIMGVNTNMEGLSKPVRDKVKALEGHSGPALKDAVKEVMSAAEALEREIAELGLFADMTECQAIISDGDLASYMPSYLTRTVTAESISGTYEFMSPRVRDAIIRDAKYLHTPVDDIHSFFFVAVWATLWNINKGHSKDENPIRNGLRRIDRDVSVASLLRDRLRPRPTYTPITIGMLPVLDDWSKKLSQLDLYSESSQDEFQETLRLVQFDLLAYRGVADFVQIIKEHYQHIQAASLSCV
ncbi:uncharacterized protein EI90DRAFT_3019966 [Cantharellus anzutake]|uniref:uncharacterized protein n=1 Tax=Cantharellus anzutake TaxID=1750568 RepID=UPI0019058B89|nr:uncharacterized protein EI90DRAFT_3019966 [Cantharellus anzutake]KAF8322905.1 hypothetical protein EI90DRAFT_3019966 [Cantharellus anzutake]